MIPPGSSTPPDRLDFSTNLHQLFLHLLPLVQPPTPTETYSERCPTSSFNLNSSPGISMRDTLVPLMDTSSPDPPVGFEETVFESPPNSPEELSFEGYSVLPSLPLKGCGFENNEPASLETPTNDFGNVVKIPLSFNKGNKMTIEGKIRKNQVSILIDTGATLSHISKGYYVSTRKDKVEGHFDPVVYFGPFPLLIYKIVCFYRFTYLCWTNYHSLVLIDIRRLLLSPSAVHLTLYTSLAPIVMTNHDALNTTDQPRDFMANLLFY